ncbi:MAG TPA: Gmad2 immunoglobulin-like domain-containing protein [Candidatus Dormibacteraeota bacterium]|nr:Gmad2 immunoglobulin-like domain-containing protein [Candidatus Dormibacteraeota bacterium]
MKGIAVAIIVAAAMLVAGCGGDTNATFVLGSGSPSTAGSGSASASPSGSTGASPGSSSLPQTAATPIDGGLRIIIDSPDGGSPISSPVEVSGTASVPNGAVIAVVKDASGNELGRGTTTASASKPDYGHYDVSVTFSGATSGAKGEIRVMDAATQKNYYFITVRFA